jgi:drug/metabolite transporter (DMT)-like permease
MEPRKPLDPQAVGLMLVLCLTWSLQQVVLKATAADIAPLLQVALRSGVAALLVGSLMLARREKMQMADGTWRAGLAVGALFALEYLLLGEGLRHTSAGHAVVFLYTAPVFAALGLHLRLPSERLAPLQCLGVALAFAGIAMTFLGRQPAAGDAGAADTLLGDLLCVGAGAAWGATTVVIRCSRLSGVPATQTLLYQLASAFVLLFVAAAILGQLAFTPTPMVIASLAFQSVVVSFASFLLWFGLLRKYLASRLGVFSFMTPLFGIVLGAWLLDEKIEATFLVGASFVLAGIVLVSADVWIRNAVRAMTGRQKAA